MTTKTETKARPKRYEFRPDDDMVAWLEARAKAQGHNVQAEILYLLDYIKKKDLRTGYWGIRYGL